MFKKKLSEWSMLPAEVEVTHFYGTKEEYLYLIECNKGSLRYLECLGCQGQYQGIFPLTEPLDIC